MRLDSKTSIFSGEPYYFRLIGCVGKVTIEISASGNTILREVYTAPSGVLMVYGINNLIEDYFSHYDLPTDEQLAEHSWSYGSAFRVTLTPRITVKATDDNGTIEETIICYPSDCDAEGTMDFSDYRTMPLSRATVKETFHGLPEYLPFFYDYTDDPYLELNARVLYYENNEVNADTIVTRRFASENYGLQIYSVPVANVELAGKLTTGFEIFHQDGEIHYEYNTTTPIEDVKTFLFRNSFHGFETIHLTGNSAKEMEIDRNVGSFRGRRKSIANKFTQRMTCNTGYLSADMLGVLEDLLCSRDVYEYDQALKKWRPVLIDETTFVVTSRKDQHISGSFSYSYAAENQRHFRYLKRKSADRLIFDETFDDTFN